MYQIIKNLFVNILALGIIVFVHFGHIIYYIIKLNLDLKKKIKYHSK